MYAYRGGVLSPGRPRTNALLLQMSDAAIFIAPTLLVAYLAVGCLLLLLGTAERR